jgi:hypothetical protein
MPAGDIYAEKKLYYTKFTNIFSKKENILWQKLHEKW